MKTTFIFMNTPSQAAYERGCRTLVRGLDARLRDMGCSTELVYKGIKPKGESNAEGKMEVSA